MPKGPRLNDIAKPFTTRNSLGIEGVAVSMQDTICPVVTTVTPRAFYWPFMVWIYYDFYKYSGIVDHTLTAFDLYLKRQDYFFVLATLLTEGADQDGLVGKLQSQIDIDNNTDSLFPFNKNYFKSTYGGMQYYYAGCLSMLFITDRDPEQNKTFSFPKLRPEGEQMAKAFEAVIKDTEYYKSYRRNDASVPRSVLEEYGKVISFGLKDFDECKAILRHFMFEDDRAKQLEQQSQLLKDNARYVSWIVKEHNVNDFSLSNCRSLFFDHRLPNGEKMSVPEECLSVANKWEIVIGRMYAASGIEMIWKYLLEQLIEPFTVREWINHALKTSEFNWNLQQPLASVVPECNYDFETREKMISASSRGNSYAHSVENGVRIILSVYNRFIDRSDIGEERALFTYGNDSQSISMTEMFSAVDKHMDKPILDFIIFIMQQWAIEQHYATAVSKMLQGRNGFYFERIDGRCIKKKEYGMFFQGIRMQQLAQVMRDLDML